MMHPITIAAVLLSGALAIPMRLSAQFVNDSTDFEIHREPCRFLIISNESDTTIAMCLGNVIISRDKITFKPDEPIRKKLDEQRVFTMTSLGLFVGNLSDVVLKEDTNSLAFVSCNKHCLIVSADVKRLKEQLEEAVYRNMIAESAEESER
ncbi:hypothetical protein JXO52_09170 [bacterium]|nr:hypothetical protein [bacterium]